MATNDTGTPTPPAVMELATRRTELTRLMLIGIFGSEESPGALVRERNGSITRVGLGDKVAGGVVAAIGQDQLILSRRGRAEILKLPQG